MTKREIVGGNIVGDLSELELETDEDLPAIDDLDDVKSTADDLVISDVQSTVHDVVNEAIPKGFSRMFLDFAPELMKNAPLVFVIGQFNNLALKLGKEDSAFFNSPKIANDFVERLREFTEYIEREIEEISKRLGFVEFQNLGTDGQWKDRLRSALYYGFFVHYGAKRRLEKDQKGNSRDYVYHVARVLFNCLIRKQNCFDEVCMIAAALHDTREDWHKGTIALWFAENDRELEDGMNGKITFASRLKEWNNLDEVEGMQRRFEQSLNPPGIKSNVAYVVDMLTKIDSEFDTDKLGILLKEVAGDKRINDKVKAEFVRVLKLLGYFYKFSEYLKGKEVDDPQVLDVFRALLVKFADRLDNCKNEKNEAILAETMGCFVHLAKSLGLLNVADHLEDYTSAFNVSLGKKIKEDRSHWNKLDYKVEADSAIKEDFRREFSEKMSPYVMGVDYYLGFRPIGKSFIFENVEEMVVELNNDRSLYVKRLRDCLIFVPKVDDPEVKKKANDVFKSIFTDCLEASKPLRRIFDGSPLVKSFMNGCFDEDPNEIICNDNVGSSEKYGQGLWRIFDSQRAAVEQMFGKLHLLLFYSKDGDRQENFNSVLKIFNLLTTTSKTMVDRFSEAWENYRTSNDTKLNGMLKDFSDLARKMVLSATGGLQIPRFVNKVRERIKQDGSVGLESMILPIVDGDFDDGNGSN